MQVTELSSNGLNKSYKIIVDKAQIQAQMEVELRAAGEQVKIPGFRPGFIPMKILQQRYGKSVQGDVLKQAINQATNDFVTEKKFRPTLTPQVNIDSYEEGGDLAFIIDFEVFPEIPAIDFSKIKLDRKIYEITEQDIDKTMETIAARNPKLIRADAGTKAALGDVTVIDFKGTVGGVAFNGGTATNFKLELGSKQFIEGFEQQLVGVKEGEERTVTVTFPKEYQAADLAGKEADFAVTVHEIHTKESAKIDDDFCKEKGFTNLRTFREAVKSQMAKEYDQIVRNHLKKDLFDILEEKSNFELPQGMLDMEFNSIWQRLQEAKKQGDESLVGKSDDELKAEYTDICKRRVKLGLLLAEVGSVNKIQITREELTRAIMEQASQYPGQENKIIDFYRKNPERVEELRGPILEEKAVDFVLNSVSFTDHKVTLDDLAEDDLDDSDETAESSKDAKSKSAKAAKKSSDGNVDQSEEEGADGAKKTSAKKKANK